MSLHLRDDQVWRGKSSDRLPFMESQPRPVGEAGNSIACPTLYFPSDSPIILGQITNPFLRLVSVFVGRCVRWVLIMEKVWEGMEGLKGGGKNKSGRIPVV